MVTSPAALSPVPGSTSADDTTPSAVEKAPPKKYTRYGKARALEPPSDTIVPSTSSECNLSDRFAAREQSWLKDVVGSLGRTADSQESDDEASVTPMKLAVLEDEVDEPTEEEARAFLERQRDRLSNFQGPASTSSLTSLGPSSSIPAIPVTVTASSKLQQMSSLTELTLSDPIKTPKPASLPTPATLPTPPTSATFIPPVSAPRSLLSLAQGSSHSQPSPSPSRLYVEDSETIQPVAKHSTAGQRMILSDDEEEEFAKRKGTARARVNITSEDHDEEGDTTIIPQVRSVDGSESDASVSEHNVRISPKISAKAKGKAKALSDDSDSDASLLSVRQMGRGRPSKAKAKSATAPAKRGVFPASAFQGDTVAMASTGHDGGHKDTLKSLPQNQLTELRKAMVKTKNEKRFEGMTRAETPRTVSDFLLLASDKLSLTAGVKSEPPTPAVEAKASSIHSDDNFGDAAQLPALSSQVATVASSDVQDTPPDEIMSYSSAAGPQQFERTACSSPTRIRKMSSSAYQPPKPLSMQDSDQVKARQEALRIKKQHALREAKRRRDVKPLKMGQPDDEDEDIILVEDTQRHSLADVKPVRPRSPPVKSMALAKLHASLNFKPQRKDELTDSFLEFAGKAFGHADMKVKQGQRSVAGVSETKTHAISNDSMGRKLYAKAQEQARKTGQEKQLLHGGTPKELAEKETLVISLPTVEPDEMEEDLEEDKDGDFQPDSGSEDEHELPGAGERDIVYSGDEGAGDVSMEEEEEASDEDKENQPPQSDDESALPAARSRRTQRVVSSPASSPPSPAIRMPLVSKSPLKVAEAPAIVFGDDDAGFSQLFGDTQVDEPGDDGFAGLRPQAAALLPAHMLLPSNNITATQRERDNAMVAAEADADAQLMTTEDESMPRYLNKEGFFTQTRPAESQSLAADLDLYPTMVESLEPESTLSPTYVSNRPAETQEEESLGHLTRLKRRRGSASRSATPPPPDESSSPTTSLTPIKLPAKRNAFDLLMDAPPLSASPRANTKHAANFLEAEAEESDDDHEWGVPRKEEDEDEAGGDDGYVEGLVNDAARTAAQEQEDEEARKEKLREQEREDEEKKLKRAQEVADGTWKRRKRGLDFDDASDDDDDDSQRVSRKEKRRRWKRVEGVDGIEVTSFENSLNAPMDITDDEDVDDGLDPSILLDKDTLDSPKLTSEQSRRRLHEVMQKQKELSPMRDMDDEEPMQPLHFVKARLPINPVRAPTVKKSNMEQYLKSVPETSTSSRSVNSSVVKTQSATLASRQPTRQKSTSSIPLRSTASLHQISRKSRFQ